MRSDDRLHPSHRSLQVRSWHGDTGVALLVPLFTGASPRPDAIARCLEEQAGLGRRLAVTGALSDAEQEPFLAAGFHLLERLHLLAHDLQGLPAMPDQVRTRRARKTDRAAVLAVDHPAFEPFWRLDQSGLDEAVNATPVSRFRVIEDRRGAGPSGYGPVDPEGVAAEGERRVVAYAVSGRAGPRGYLQRLAVHPDHQGRGLGSALIIDGLRWMRRRGAERALVNTQERNVGALALYERLGFRREPEGLAVLAYPLTGSPE